MINKNDLNKHYNNISSNNTLKRTKVLQVWSDKVER